MQTRCDWAAGDPVMVAYHDEEWGVPVYDDTRFFEFLTLEGAQAGLSWLTVLRKRRAYFEAFQGFNPAAVAEFSQDEVEHILAESSVIRNRRKVESTVTNARHFLEVQAEAGSFSEYIWSFVDGRPVINHWQAMSEVPVSTPLAESISKDLKRRGFSFVGPTIMYSFLQATGLVMDHLTSCFCHPDHASTFSNNVDVVENNVDVIESKGE